MRSRITSWTAPARLAAAVPMLALLVACGGERPPASDSAAATVPAPAAEPAPAAVASAAPDGAQLYQRCATCHQVNGAGVAGAFPPLAGSEFVLAANPTAAIRVVLRGMQGPVTVKGATYNSVMVAYGTGAEMSDAEVAAVLTYVRSAWGNSASAVTPDQVAAERPAAKAAGKAVTADELKALL